MFLKQFGIFDSTPVVTFVGVAVLVSVSTDARNAGNTKKASNNTVYLLIKKWIIFRNTSCEIDSFVTNG